MKVYIILLIIIYINDLKYFIVKIFILKKISNDTTKLQSLGDDLGLTTKHHFHFCYSSFFHYFKHKKTKMQKEHPHDKRQIGRVKPYIIYFLKVVNFWRKPTVNHTPILSSIELNRICYKATKKCSFPFAFTFFFLCIFSSVSCFQLIQGTEIKKISEDSFKISKSFSLS